MRLDPWTVRHDIRFEDRSAVVSDATAEISWIFMRSDLPLLVILRRSGVYVVFTKSQVDCRLRLDSLN